MNLPDALQMDMNLLDEQLYYVIRTDPDLSEQSIIHQSIHDLIEAGGKRLRPILTLVGSRFGVEPESPLVYELAAMLEYIHMASLIHDDMIDRSEVRRNMPALHVQIGIAPAVHIANYMMARVMEWAASLTGHPTHFTKTLANLVTKLCLGEYQQLHTRFNFNVTIEDYLTKSNHKTALMIATCLQAGSFAAQADDQIGKLLYEYGQYVGLAFQIRDDVLDFTSTEQALGKPAGADLLNGNVTLPVLYALEIPKLASYIRALNRLTPDIEVREVIKMIATSSAIERSLDLAAYYANEAELIIDQLTAYPAYQDLLTILHYFIRKT